MAFAAIMVVIPATSFNTAQSVKINEKSEVMRHIEIEKAKIKIELKRATYSEGISQTY